MFNKIGSLRKTAVTENVETFEGIKSLPQVSEIQVKKLEWVQMIHDYLW